jgi:hypothetical protein
VLSSDCAVSVKLHVHLMSTPSFSRQLGGR